LNRCFIGSLAALGALGVGAGLALAQGTAFTYPGELTNGATAANGVIDMRFHLFDAASGGSQVGATQCADNVPLAGGRFAVMVDFGSVFTGQPRFLEIEVRQDTGLNRTNVGGFTVLAPRQSLSPTPRASAASTANALSAPDGSP
jgi:hypothetical protein